MCNLADKISVFEEYYLIIHISKYVVTLCLWIPLQEFDQWVSATLLKQIGGFEWL